PHRLLRLLRQPGGHLRLPDRYGLCPGSGGVLSPLLHLYFCGLPLVRLVRRRQGSGQGNVPAHRQTCHHFPGHLLL
ncbi:hypothetical protein GOGPGP_GOGPGP_14175, partial [Dysosmobacter welbionis]